jgi:hypothetical protein
MKTGLFFLLKIIQLIMHEFRIIPESSCIISYLLFCRSYCTQLDRSTMVDESQMMGTAVASCSCCGTTIRLKVPLKIIYLIGINLQSGGISNTCKINGFSLVVYASRPAYQQTSDAYQLTC